MFEVVPYKHEHILPLIEQKINRFNKEFFLNGVGREFEKQGTAVTGLWNGTPVICGAINEIWENRGMVWCMFNEEVKYNFVPVFRGIKKFIEQSKFRRIEICIPCDMKQSRRRTEMLGFKLECDRAEKFLRDGTDCALYALVR